MDFKDKLEHTRVNLTGCSAVKIALDLVWQERLRQISKWGKQEHNDPRWITILAEEFGEAAAEVCGNLENSMDEQEYLLALMDELIQVAAVAVAHVEHLMERYDA